MTNKERIQRAVADVLTQFMFVRTMEDVHRVWKDVYEQYDLCDDPFTGCPCSNEDYADNNLEYQRQAMVERFGHCDGLE